MKWLGGKRRVTVCNRRGRRVSNQHSSSSSSAVLLYYYCNTTAACCCCRYEHACIMDTCWQVSQLINITTIFFVGSGYIRLWYVSQYFIGRAIICSGGEQRVSNQHSCCCNMHALWTLRAVFFYLLSLHKKTALHVQHPTRRCLFFYLSLCASCSSCVCFLQQHNSS